MTHYFSVAELPLAITFVEEDAETGIHLIPSFEPFRIDSLPQEESLGALFHLTVDNTLRPVPKEHRQRVRVFDTGNGDTVVDKVDNGGYQYIIKDIYGNDCAMLICNADFSECQCAVTGTETMRHFGLNNALMLTYAFAGSTRETVLIHASLVRHEGYGYGFVAKSGTGKSTQVANWLKTIPNCDMMNDDNPIVRVIDGKSFIYGSPWSGKTPCYRNVKAPLGALTKIDRALENSVDRLAPLDAFGTVLPSCSAMKWDETVFNGICDTVTGIVSSTPIYVLHCTVAPESARVCCDAIKVR